MGLNKSKDVMMNDVFTITCDNCKHIILDGKYNIRPDENDSSKPFYWCAPCWRKIEDPQAIDHIQQQLKEWTLKQFDQEYPNDRLVIGSFYMGQLQLLHMKSIRIYGEGSTEEILAKKKSCLGAVALALMTYASDNRLNFFEVIKDHWADVQKLDFIQYPMTGKPPKEGDMDDEIRKI